ncbi:MAG TPA: hypothetical protein VLJ62_22330 [Burkholderiaceae bacterium]|nr:hypothetical protein [Burkholderiaceae bacterium]
MNTSATPSAATASCDRASAPKAAGEPNDPFACNAFERALQQRQRQQRSGDGDEEPPGEPAVLPAMPPLMLSPAQTLALPPLSSAGALDPAPTGTRAALEASLRESPCPQGTPIGGTEAAMTWEATVNEPNSLALEVRAVRAERTALSGPQAAWGLTIASPTVGVEVLARHVPRLNERLRKHAIGPEHVRIEQARDDDE